MKLNLHITLTVLSGVILAGLLAGCPMPTKEGISRSATEYNLVAEKAGNEMLLLNIVRASKRRPMYFTSFGKLTGNMAFEIGTGSINIPFGKIGTGLNGSYSIAPSAGYKNSPLFDVAVLDTQEFTKGIMTPVPMKTIEYYRSQGWPKEMLLYLFIRRIDIIDPNYPNDPNRVKTYVNNPEDQGKFKKFQNQIQTKNWKWEIEEVNAMCIGEVDAIEASKLQNLIKVQKAGLRLRPGKEKNKKELCLSQDKYVFSRVQRVSPEDKEDKMVPQTFSPDPPSKADAPSGSRVYLRSPEAILYYLGEILRVEIRAENRGVEDPNVPKIYAGHGERKADEAWLFYACKARDEDVTPCVSVDYEGTKYVIPGDPDSYDGCCTDQSMHVMSLVSQLIGLQKKSEEVPATGVVSVVGR